MKKDNETCRESCACDNAPTKDFDGSQRQWLMLIRIAVQWHWSRITGEQHFACIDIPVY